MQELRAQIQAQLKLAETLKKLAEHAGKNSYKFWSQTKTWSLLCFHSFHMNMSKKKKHKTESRGTEVLKANRLNSQNQAPETTSTITFFLETFILVTMASLLLSLTS